MIFIHMDVQDLQKKSDWEAGSGTKIMGMGKILRTKQLDDRDNDSQQTAN